jgi:hypothetical protein
MNPPMEMKNGVNKKERHFFHESTLGIWMLSTGHIKHAQNKTMSHER